MLTLSVIIPVYNTHQYLRECVDSVSVRDGIEVILVDDGSDDKVTSALCDEIARERADVRTLHSENRGLGGARNLGLENANGDYVLFFDSDDLLADGAIDSLLSAAEKHRSPDVIEFDFLIRTQDGKDKPSGESIHAADGTFTALERPECLLSLPSAWSRAWKRSFLLSTGITFPPRLRYEDLATIPALIAAAGSVCSIGSALYIYRIRDGSIMTDASPIKNRDVTAAFDLLLSHFDALGLTDAYENELCHLAVSHVMLAASARVLSQNGREAETTAKALVSYVKDRFPDLRRCPYLSRLNVREKILFRLLESGRIHASRTLVRLHNALK